MKTLIALLVVYLSGCSTMLGPMERSSTIRKLDKSVTTLYILDDDNNTIASGSGFAISENLLITAEHVCDAVDYEAKIGILRPSGTIQYMTPISRNPAGDVCLMYGDHSLSPLHVSPRDIRLGDKVWLYGSPLGVDGIVTFGYAGKIIKLGPMATRRSLSVPAFGGNSGCPVLNENGQVVGVLVSGYRGYSQLTFATTHEDLLNILE